MLPRRRKRNFQLCWLELFLNPRISRTISTVTEIPLLGCTICYCRLNGIEPVNQHVSSTSHIRKVEIKKAALRSRSSKLSDSTSHQVCTSQHETSTTHLSTEQDTVNLNPLGLGDGIQVLQFQNAPLPSFVRPGQVSDLTRGVNISQEETNLSAAAMNIFSLQPQRGPKGEAYVMVGGKGFCYICNIELTSQQHCQQHIKGSKHIKKDKDITSLLANSQPGNAHLLNPAQILLPQEHNVRVDNNGGPNGSVYDVLGPGGHCYVCNVVFTSTQLANEHIAGQKHRKKVASQNLLDFGDHKFSGVVSSEQPARVISSAGPSSDVSSSVINSWQTVGYGFNAADHIPSVATNSEQFSRVGFRQTGNIPLNIINSVPTAGNASPVRRDSRQIEEYILADVITAGHTPEHNTGVASGMDRPGQTTALALTNALNSKQAHGYISNNFGSGVLSGNIPPHIATSGQVTRSAASSGIGLAPQLVPSRGPNGEPYIMNGDRGYCYICKLELTSASHAQSHITGKKHKKKNWEEMSGSVVNTSADGILSSDKSGVLMCSICNVPFSSPENARQHFMSDRHRKKLPYYVFSNVTGENLQETNPEQTGVMKVYHPPTEMPAQGVTYSHGLIKDLKTSFEQEQGEQPFAPNREFQKSSSTEAYVMNDDRGSGSVYNVEVTSPQQFRQHIEESKHIIEKESFSLKSLETVDPEQTKVMKLYDSTDQISAHNNSHGLITDITNTIENAELQIKSEHLVPPSGGLPTEANTETDVMSDNRDTCGVYNTELTSSQDIQVHKNIDKVNELLSGKSRETVDSKQSQIVGINQSQVQNVPGIPESDPLKALGSFNNSIGYSTSINQRSKPPLLPSVAYSITRGIPETDPLKALGSFHMTIGNSTLINQPFKSLSFPSVAYSNITEEEYSLPANTNSSETNASDPVLSMTVSDSVIKSETSEQSNSATSNTQTKYMLQNDNLSNQRKEPLKVGNKETNDFAEHGNLGSQQKEPLKVESKEINSTAEHDNLNSQHKEKEPLKVEHKEIVHSNDYAEHGNLSSQQKEPLKVERKEINSNAEHDNLNSQHKEKEPLKVEHKEINSNAEHDNLNRQHKEEEPLKVESKEINSIAGHDNLNRQHKEKEPLKVESKEINSIAGHDNLNRQQKEPLKVENKEIVHSNDYAEHDTASYNSITENHSITENNQQPSEIPASEDSKYNLSPPTQPGGIQPRSYHSSASLSIYSAPETSPIDKMSLSNDKLAIKSVYPLTDPLHASNKESSIPNKSVPYHFNGSNGYCFCCSVELTSLKHANQHLYGQKHKKRLGQWELASAFQNGLTSAFQNGLTSAFENGLTSAFQNGLSQQTHPPSELPAQQHTEDNSYYFNGDRGFCHVCNIELTSLQHAQQHTRGKPHKRARERFNKSQNGVVYPLNCQICSKLFTGQESAQQHFTSAKHKIRADVLNESAVVLSVVDEGRVVMKDGQLWHVCDVCKVAMNTREQFLFHRESLKHKKECENASRISFSETVDVNNDVITSDPSNGSMRTSSLSSSSRASSVETVQNELDLAVNRSLQAKFEDLQIQDEANKQRVLDENRHYLTYGQVAVNSQDIGKVASSGQHVANEDIPVFAGSDQLLISRNAPVVAGSGRPLINLDIAKAANLAQPLSSQNTPVVAGAIQSLYSQDTPTGAGSGQPLSSRDTPTGAGSGQPLSSQGIPVTSGSGTTALMNSNMTSTIFKGPVVSSGYPVTGAMSTFTAPTFQSSVLQKDTKARSQAQTTDRHSVSSDYLSEHPRLSSAQANSDSSQMYADFWQSLGASGGQNAGLDLQAFSPTRDRATLPHPSGGNTKAASSHVSDSPSRSVNEGIRGSSGEDTSTSEDAQNHLNSLPGDESFSNSYNLGNVMMTPRPSRQSRSRGNERRNDVLCLDKKDDDDEFNDDYEEEGIDDLNIVEVPPEVPVPVTTPAVPVRSGKPGFRYYCPICNKHMNTREAYETHVKGKNHVFMLSSQPAPARNFEPIYKVCTNEDDLVLRMCGVISKELKITPRFYQIELVVKAMKGDCIIYLPTGTGKTLVAVLTMGLMLQDNPSRPVLFLVDKVLLVMQQAQYIIRHFAGTLFKRQDGNPGSPLVTRVLQVKPICGGLTTKTDLPVWKHDIVVTTAAYCANMLDRGQIRWEDFSLVVLDEVHHCGKGHPYHRLMSTYHCSLPEHARAKVLGLTASPAGKSTVEQTYIMLKSLLQNLGGASVAVVEEPKNIVSLDHYQSMAKVKPICVPMSSKEIVFKGYLLEYFILCYSQLALMTNDLRSNEPPCSYFLDALHKPGNREVAFQLAEKFMRDPEPLSEVLDVIHRARCIDEADVAGRNRFDNLRLHICKLLLIIPEVGSGADIDDLLATLAPSGPTEEYKKMGLPCDQIYQRAKHFATDGNNDLTMFSKLVETLQDPDVINWTDTSSRALVLVRERKRARQYCLKLRAHPMVESKQLRVGHIVGHGKGAKDGGMDVKKQRRVFDNHEKYHILVATSIMEEGIDIQALQLVVCMNPPNSLRALVQMRGRARRGDSHFVVLCSSQEDVDKLNSLQKQEQNMQEAAKLCLAESKKC